MAGIALGAGEPFGLEYKQRKGIGVSTSLQQRRMVVHAKITLEPNHSSGGGHGRDGPQWPKVGNFLRLLSARMRTSKIQSCNSPELVGLWRLLDFAIVVDAQGLVIFCESGDCVLALRLSGLRPLGSDEGYFNDCDASTVNMVKSLSTSCGCPQSGLRLLSEKGHRVRPCQSSKHWHS
jgi:hypothetical protein